jgi:hypothetical protein
VFALGAIAAAECILEFYQGERFAPDNAEWTPKTDVVALDDVRDWFESADIEILGFAYSLVNDARFRIEPPFRLTNIRISRCTITGDAFEKTLKENGPTPDILPAQTWLTFSPASGGTQQRHDFS